jgi:hypothetical protein
VYLCPDEVVHQRRYGELLLLHGAFTIKRVRRQDSNLQPPGYESNGYFTEADPLSNNELRARVIMAVADDVNAGRIDLKSIDRIIASLPEKCDSSSRISM